MKPSRTALTLVVLGLTTSVARAEDAAATPLPPAGPQAAAPAAASTPGLLSATYAAPSTAWQLHGALGFGAADGKYGDVLQKPLQWDIGIAKRSASGKWLFGVNLQFGSMDPADDPNIPPETAEAWLAPDLEWARLETSFSVSRVFNPGASFRPYLEGRIGIERIHPRSELFWEQPPPEDLEPGDSPTAPANGIGFTLQPGFEVSLGKTLSLDVAAFGTFYKTGAYDMDPLGLPDDRLRFRVGRAHGPQLATVLGDATRSDAQGDPGRPGHGQAAAAAAARRPPRRLGRAAQLGLGDGRDVRDQLGRLDVQRVRARRELQPDQPAQLLGTTSRKASPTTTTSSRPTSWSHPFNGSTYYNAARANGIGFWGSSAMALAGAFVWECCGETHPMSYNDMISTGFGGIARGEVAHRISSLILDNTKRGAGRWTREITALLVDPMRGFNRLVSGDANEVKGNPVHPYDYRPDFQLFLRAGGRVIGEGESISENTNKYGFFEVALSYGDAWDPDNRRPYDRFDIISQSNFGDKTRVGRLLIRGDIVSKLVAKNHSLAFEQDFDYIDNEAFEYGGQSFGPALLSRFELSDKFALTTRAQVFFILLGAVNSNLSFLADVAEQERIREYDYGPGAGVSAEAYLMRKNIPVLVARYRGSYIDVSNGSIYNNDTADIGLNSTHGVQQLQVKLEIPVGKGLSVGADGSMFFRRSHYDFDGSGVPPEIGEGRRTITQRNPEARVFLAWSYSH